MTRPAAKSPLKQFTYLLKRIVSANNLPDYDLGFVNTADNSPAVHFIRRDAVGRAAIKAELAQLSAQTDRKALDDARVLEVDAMFEHRRVRSTGDQ